MSASLVGSEMCIRDSFCDMEFADAAVLVCKIAEAAQFAYRLLQDRAGNCLLYTSDAADDM
eukprot:10798363-Alexandrium_andersonii.AAC.1